MQVLTETNFPKEVQVSFVTKTFPHKTPATPFAVPSDTTRFGLSEIVNHLLHDELNGEIVPFEFLVEYREGKKVFLRTSLRKFFVKIQKYPESIVTLEYVESTPPPKHVDTIPHDDWISVISKLSNDAQDGNEYVFSGAYDGIVRLIQFPLKKTRQQQSQTNSQESSNGSGQVILKTHALGSAISSICGWKDKSSTVVDNELLRYVVSCKDETLRLYTVSRHEGEKLRVDLKVRFKGHEDAITCTDVNKSQTMCCSGSDDKFVRIWDLTRFEESAMVEEQPNKKKKRRIDVFEGQSVAKLDGHILGITDVKYSPLGDAIISSGMDHTIRTHDLTTGSNSNTIHGAKPATCIAPHSQFSTNPIILSSYPDHIVRLHDTRVSGKAQIFKSHKAWVRGVQWINKNGSDDVTSFVSWGDDNHLKVWDLRSAVPVHSFKHSDVEQNKWVSDWKVLAGCSISDGILSGGSDCMLKKHLV